MLPSPCTRSLRQLATAGCLCLVILASPLPGHAGMDDLLSRPGLAAYGQSRMPATALLGADTPFLSQARRVTVLYTNSSGDELLVPAYVCRLQEEVPRLRIKLACVMEWPVDQNVLNCLGWDVHQQVQGHLYDRVFIRWYLPDYDPEGGAWGLTGFVDDKPSVQIWRIQDQD